MLVYIILTYFLINILENKTKQNKPLTGTDSHKLFMILGIEKEISTFDETIEWEKKTRILHLIRSGSF